MSSVLDNNTIQQWELDLLDGYTKEIQPQLSTTIPRAIVKLCLLYHSEVDKWADCINAQIERNVLIADDTTAESVGLGLISVNGDSHCIYEWNFIINVSWFSPAASPWNPQNYWIGLTKGNTDWTNCLGYLLKDDGSRIKNINKCKSVTSTHGWDYDYSNEITMRLNTVTKQIKYYKDGVGGAVAFDNVDCNGLQLLVRIGTPTAEVVLADFKKILVRSYTTN